MSFTKLKKNRNKSMDKLRSAVESTKTGRTTYEDEKEWKPTVDKAGNGYAVIRFLPSGESALPWVRYWDHGFKGNTGKWYFEKSLTTINQPDPVGEENQRLWNTGVEEDKDTARLRKRRLHYVSNIIVIADSANPENEGKIFKYQYGKKIFDKITEAMEPEFEDETPVNPFDFWEGANFKLKIRQVAGYRNYDASSFDNPSALFGGDDAKLEEVYNQMHDLSDYTDPSSFKSYAELQKKFKSVIGDNSVVDEPVVESSMAAAPTVKIEEDDDVPMSYDSDDKDENLTGYFAKLAEED
jgi:hypothetical protein